MAFKQIRNGVIVSVYVKPSSRKNEIAWVGDELHILTKEPPADSKANISVIKMLAKAVGIPQSSISMMRGQTARKKELLITGVTLSGLGAALKLKKKI